MKTILFQGDSITDADRSRQNNWMLGSGYPTVVAGMLGSEAPDGYNFLNRGVSGNRIVDVYSRIRCDILNLNPDYLSILIGVNDVWHDQFGNGVDAVKFKKIYGMLIEEVLEALPDVKIIVMEPFVLPGSATDESYEGFFRPEVEKRAEAARETAEKYGLCFLPLQKKFDEVYPLAPKGYWLADGVHPAPAGHGLIARAWMDAFAGIK